RLSAAPRPRAGGAPPPPPRLDFVEQAALVATLREGGPERIIGVGRYAMLPTRPGAARAAEVAFAVADEYQGRGIGTLLLEHLIPLARANGIAEFQADVLGENNRMLQVFARSGFVVTSSVEAGVVHLSFPTEETAGSREAAAVRERLAAAESVRMLLNPRAVAVVGASRERGTIGAALTANLVRAGFTGSIYPVNPNASEIERLLAYPSIGAIGAPVDLAIIAVPAAAVEGVVEECAGAGVKGVVVISSGFAEASEAGRAAQDRLTRLVRGAGMRMVG